MLSRLALALFLAFAFITPALAQEPSKPDDVVSFDLSAEDWVNTKTAHVTLGIEAAVNSSNAGTVRADMTKAVNDSAKADWRLTGFNRLPDQTGMERWSVSFEARLPESALNGLRDSVKKASKAGMQITVSGVDFSPSREEMEDARAALRTKIFKNANEQLTALNATLPGRAYRISQITFETDFPAPIQMYRNKRMMDGVAMASAAVPPRPEMEQAEDVSQKLILTAHVVFAALPPASR
ncbi:MAG: SIMPL domain-containing protein [Bdellovibrionales bacterium]